MSSLLSGTLPLNEAHGVWGHTEDALCPQGHKRPTWSSTSVLALCVFTSVFGLLSFSPKHRANFTYVGNLNFLTPVLYVRGDEVITSL